MKKRSLRQILEYPQSDREERIADKHIRRECAKIRASWSEDELFWRARQMPDGPRGRVVRGDDGQLHDPVELPTWTAAEAGLQRRQ